MIDTPLTQRGSRRVLYRLIDKDGNETGRAIEAQWLAEQAKKCWPDQEQDETRSGKGWDIEVAGTTPND